MRSYPKTAVPSRFERHLLNRMGTGYTPAAWRQLRRAGGAMQWFEAQLDPSRVRESAKAAELLSWYPDRGTAWARSLSFRSGHTWP